MSFTARLRLAAGTALIGAALLPAAAMAQAYSPERVKKSIELGDLKAVVSSLGHTVEEEGVSGARSLRALDDDGIRYLLIGTACDANGVPGCQGIKMQVHYDLPDGVTYERVAQANLKQVAVVTWVNFESDTLGFTRYQVLDHGVTMANIRENVLVLLDVYPLAMDVATGEASE